MEITIVRVTGWTTPRATAEIDEITAHATEEKAIEWAEDQSEISYKGYELHTTHIRGLEDLTIEQLLEEL